MSVPAAASGVPLCKAVSHVQQQKQAETLSSTPELHILTSGSSTSVGSNGQALKDFRPNWLPECLGCVLLRVWVKSSGSSTPLGSTGQALKDFGPN
jgi:hypothetical protein